jgi:Spy/CpxP family protein refolding chaperone
MSTEEISDRVDRRVERILSRVDGTPEQRQQISTIAKAAINDLKTMEFAPREVHSKAVELLSADTFDRAALETLRAEQVVKFDAASKRIVQAVSDAAGVLTVEQRKELVAKMGERGWRGGDRERHGRHGGGWGWR